MDFTEYCFRINSADKISCEPCWIWKPETQKWRDIDLWVVCKGEGTLATADGLFELSRGDVFWLQDPGTYEGKHNPAHPLQVIAIHFDILDSCGKRVPKDRLDSPVLHRRIGDMLYFQSLLERVVQMFRMGKAKAADCFMRAVVMETVLQEAQDWPNGRQNELLGKIRNLCRTISENPSRPFSVDTAAAQFCFTPQHFTRVFKKYTGISPNAFVIRERIGKAKSLLTESSMTIGQIADALGYSDVYFFSKQFSRYSGSSPLQYRRIL